jgi:transcriptional regulator with XRE-family HTH domain
MDQRPHNHCDLRASFATAFSNWRRKNGIPLKAVAQDLGTSISTVAAWESGEYFPTGSHLERLVDYTGLPPCRLFCVMADKCVPDECVMAMSEAAARRVDAGSPGPQPIPSPQAASRPVLARAAA